MRAKSVNFEDKKKKKWILQKKKVIKIDEIDVNKILISKKEPSGTKNSFKYFIGYNDNYVIRPLCVRLPQMTAYARKCDENATMSFKANNKQLLQNYDKMWGKLETLLQIKFESKPVYRNGDKYIKTKVKIYLGHIITHFHSKKCQKKKHHANVYQ